MQTRGSMFESMLKIASDSFLSISLDRSIPVQLVGGPLVRWKDMLESSTAPDHSLDPPDQEAKQRQDDALPASPAPALHEDVSGNEVDDDDDLQAALLASLEDIGNMDGDQAEPEGSAKPGASGDDTDLDDALSSLVAELESPDVGGELKGIPRFPISTEFRIVHGFDALGKPWRPGTKPCQYHDAVVDLRDLPRRRDFDNSHGIACLNTAYSWLFPAVPDPT